MVDTGGSIDHYCSLGAHSFVAPEATLRADVASGEKVLVGAGAVILPGAKVARGSIIEDGVVLLHDVARTWS